MSMFVIKKDTQKNNSIAIKNMFVECATLINCKMFFEILLKINVILCQKFAIFLYSQNSTYLWI